MQIGMSGAYENANLHERATTRAPAAVAAASSTPAAVTAAATATAAAFRAPPNAHARERPVVT